MERQGWAFRKEEIPCAKSRDVREHIKFHKQGRFSDVQFCAADWETSWGWIVEGHVCATEETRGSVDGGHAHDLYSGERQVKASHWVASLLMQDLGSRIINKEKISTCRVKK